MFSCLRDSSLNKVREKVKTACLREKNMHRECETTQFPFHLAIVSSSLGLPFTSSILYFWLNGIEVEQDSVKVDVNIRFESIDIVEFHSLQNSPVCVIHLYQVFDAHVKLIQCDDDLCLSI